MKKVLVLSGGSIKGAFQAGAIADILTSGSFTPDAIYGTSVGSLNGAFLADRAGRAVIAGESPNWVKIGNDLQHFWLQEINSFKKIGKERGKLKLLYSIIFNKFDGFIDMSPLYGLIHKVIKRENLLKSPIDFYACAVDVATGKPIYAIAKDHPKILDYIIASTAIPMVMPLRMINSNPFVDGGIREVAPLHRAIKDGADEIYCILCQPKELTRKSFDHKSALKLMDRLMSITTNETVNNDIDHCLEINEIVDQMSQPITSGPMKGKRNIKLMVIRPPQPIDLNLTTFTQGEIKKALQYGWSESQKKRV